MRYTAIALDFDGTIAHDSFVPPNVVAGLRRLKSSGRKLILVTGRELPELLDIFPEITLFDRAVVENGALLYRPATGQKQELGESPPPELVRLLKERGVPLSVGQSIIATVEPHETVVLKTIRELGLERPVIFNKGAVMILPPGINKATGLAVALAELGLSARNVVAAGDAENDHALLDAAEYSVAVSNAIATLKAAADRITTSPRGEGVLEVIADLIESDLARSPPKRQRRRVLLGKDAQGGEFCLAASGTSLLVTGKHKTGKSALVRGLLERLCKLGYQFCLIDGRGEYLDFEPAIVFGTPEHPPDPLEVFTALEKPDLHAVVCLAAIEPRQRPAFFASFAPGLEALREKTGRPHWLVVDDARELAPKGDPLKAHTPEENTIYVTADPGTVSNSILTRVDVVAACGANARKPDEVMVSRPRSGDAPKVVTFIRGSTPKRAMRNGVGKVLRRA